MMMVMAIMPSSRGGYDMHQRRNERNTSAPDHIVRIVVHRPSVEHGVPMTSRMGRLSYEYPFHDMLVGDSFVVTHAETPGRTIFSRVHAHNARNRATKFECRTQTDGNGGKLVRIWRTR